MLSLPDFSKKQVLLLFPNKGEKLAFKNDNLIVKDADGKTKHQSTCYRLFAVFIIGDTTITTGLIRRAAKFGFSIALFSTTFRLYQVINSNGEGNTILREKQYSVFDDLQLAKNLITNKIKNQRAVLMKQRYKSEYTKEAISNIDEYLNSIKNATTLQQIMGYESLASKLYFQSHFNNVLWTGRKPRIKHDMVNSLLDIGYTVLFSYVETVLKIFGFDCYKGFMHTQFYMRKSLVCDIVEPFRPIIDERIKKSINLNQFIEDDFEIINQKWKESSRYTAVILKSILEHKEDIYLYIREFYRQTMKNEIIDKFPVFILE